MTLAGPLRAQPFLDTVVALENQKPGTSLWQLANPAQHREIEGYASLTSVNRGGEIQFFVNTTNAAFTLDVYRIGWYGGAGGRQVFGPWVLPGCRQPMPPRDPATGLIECNWTNPCTLSVAANAADPTDWASGVYVAKLTGSQDGKQSYIIFAVRDDDRPSELLAQMSFTTYQAYNPWGGSSLYAINSPRGTARKVSFNRPFELQSGRTNWPGAGEFFSAPTFEADGGWECNLVRWLEREGYDVSYCTSLDVHANTNLLGNHKTFLSMGHDEYWSYPMRWNVERARDQGVNLAFFSANVCYWQVRFEPGLDGTPNRTMVCYKSTEDPVFHTPSNHLTTVNFRAAPVNNSEAALLGVAFCHAGVLADMVVSDPSHWIFANTGVRAGQQLNGLVGMEVDATNSFSPANIQVACTSPFVNLDQAGADSDETEEPGDELLNYSQAASYTTANGATVFASGSWYWCRGMDDFGYPERSFQNPIAQQITRNVLARLGHRPVPAPTFFFRPDLTTRGAWKTWYGAEGCLLPNETTNLPSFATVQISGASWLSLLDLTTNSNALQRASSAGRYLGGWSAQDGFTVDLHLTDTTNHLVGFYVWDWNHAGRTQLVQVVDAVSTNLLDQRTIGGSDSGQWWVWQVHGHVQFRFSRLTGPDCLVSAMVFGTGSGVQSLGEDPLTQGDWKSRYGTEGAYIVGDSFQNFSYASLRWVSAATTISSLSTTERRAPEVLANTNRILIGWSGFSPVQFFLQCDDSAWHRLALYCVDAQRLGVRQRFTLVDALNNAVLDTRELADFQEGKYAVWNVRGPVKVRVETNDRMLPIVNGLFLDPPNHPPEVTWLGPTNASLFHLPTNIVLSLAAADADDGIRQVEFYSDGSLLASVSQPPFTWTWTNAQAASHLLHAIAIDRRLAATTTPSLTLRVAPPEGYPPPLVQVDLPTNGSVYQAPAQIPLAATVPAGLEEVRALQFLVDGEPFGPALTGPPFVCIASDLTPGIHSVQAAVRDTFGETILSATNRITVRPAPTASILQPANGACFTPGGNIDVLVHASPGFSCPLKRVELLANSVVIGADSTEGDRWFVWTNPPPGVYELSARAIGDDGTAGLSAPVSVTIERIAAAAVLLQTDAIHQGNWRGVLGQQGYVLAGAGSHPPSGVTLGSIPQEITWGLPVTDPRALQLDNGTGRIAAAWYAVTNLILDIAFEDPFFHRVGLYFVDWPPYGAGQMVDVLDHGSGALLDRQFLPSFTGGLTCVWDARGHLRFRITRQANPVALLSGVFFDPGHTLSPLTLTNPASGLVVVAPTNIDLIASIPPDPRILRVDFYAGTNLLGTTSSGPPYSLTWSNAEAGLWPLVARAVGSEGTSDSAPVWVRVLAGNAMALYLLPDSPPPKPPPSGVPGPYTYEPCEDVAPMPDYENVLTD